MSDRVTGTVAFFNGKRGFGTIQPTGTVDKEDGVFVHWKGIQSDARWPSLSKGQKVEFVLEKKGDKTQAVDVTALGGENFSDDEEERDLIEGGPWKGEVKFYDAKKGFGFITPLKKVPGLKKGVDVYVTREEIHVADGDHSPFLMEAQKVRFEVFRGDDGKPCATAVTQGNGKPIVNPRDKIQKKSSWKSPAKKGWKKKSVWKSSIVEDGWKSSGSDGWKKGPGGSSTWKKSKKGGKNAAKKSGWKRSREIGGVDILSLAKRLRAETSSSEKAEIGVALKRSVIGGIIGKQGKTIRKIIKQTKARINFGDEDFQIEGETYRVLAMSGSIEACVKASQLISEQRSRAAESLDARMIFLCPAEFCGFIIGKKGETIKKISKPTNPNCFLKVNVSDDEVEIPGADPVNLVTLFGGQATVKEAIEKAVNVLGEISHKKRERQLEKVFMSKLSGSFGMRGRF